MLDDSTGLGIFESISWHYFVFTPAEIHFRKGQSVDDQWIRSDDLKKHFVTRIVNIEQRILTLISIAIRLDARIFRPRNVHLLTE